MTTDADGKHCNGDVLHSDSIDRLCTDTFSPLKRGIRMRVATICPQTVYYIIAVCKAVVVALVCQLRISITHAQYAWSSFSCKANWLIMTWNKAYMLIYTHCFTYIRICNDSPAVCSFCQHVYTSYSTSSVGIGFTRPRYVSPGFVLFW